MGYAAKDYRMEWHQQTETSIPVPLTVVAKMLNTLVFKPDTECWIYDPPGVRNPNTRSYPSINWNNKEHTIKLSRLALIFDTDAPAPPGLDALHSCGNHRCCAPYHLRWGTDDENWQDRRRHEAERAARQRPRPSCEG